MTARTHAEIIEALGGPRVVADALGIPSSNTVLYWTRPKRRIPSKHWPQLLDMQSAKQAGVTAEELMGATVSGSTRSAPSECAQAEAA